MSSTSKRESHEKKTELCFITDLIATAKITLVLCKHHVCIFLLFIHKAQTYTIYGETHLTFQGIGLRHLPGISPNLLQPFLSLKYCQLVSWNWSFVYKSSWSPGTVQMSIGHFNNKGECHALPRLFAILMTWGSCGAPKRLHQGHSTARARWPNEAKG